MMPDSSDNSSKKKKIPSDLLVNMYIAFLDKILDIGYQSQNLYKMYFLEYISDFYAEIYSAYHSTCNC